MELKKVFVLDDTIINIGDWDFQESYGIIGNPLPQGAIEEYREMFLNQSGYWEEPGKPKEPNELEKIKADLHYLSIMTGVVL